MSATKGLLAALVAALLSLAAAPALTYIVLESRGDAAARYPKGTLLVSGRPFELGANSELVLLSEAGELRTIRGPVRDLAAQGANAPTRNNALKALAELLARQDNGRVAIGATRGGMKKAAIDPGGMKAAADPWVIDVTSAGAKCLFADRPATLWRSDGSPAARASLEAVGGGEKVDFDWPAGVATFPWPREIPRKTGEIYLLSTGTGIASQFTLAVTSAESTPGTALLFMAESGCLNQAAQLLAEVTNARGQK